MVLCSCEEECGSARDGLQRVAELAGLRGRHLDDQPPAALEGDAHDDATALLGHLERAVAGPRLHGRHAASPSSCRAHGAPSGHAAYPVTIIAPELDVTK